MFDHILTEDQIMLRDATREFAREVVAPRAFERDEAREFPADEVAAAAEIGLLGLAVPEEYGGFPVDTVTTALVYDELSQASAAMSLILSIHNSLVCAAIASWGTDEFKAESLPKLASGEWLGAYALTEPEAGSDAASIRTKARQVEGGWAISGQKVFTSSAGEAGVIIVFAVTDPGARTSRRISAFAVERGSDGFSVGPPEKKLGLHSSPIHQLQFDDCFVPAERLIGDVGQGFPIAMTLLDAGRIGIASQATGITAAALEKSLAYANQRKQFGQTIGSYQAIQWKLVDMTAQLDAARLMIWRAATLKDASKPYGLEASKAKLLASELAVRATGEAIQIHGGYGYIRETGVERLYRDARVTTIYEGTSEIQRMVIARKLLAGD